MCFKNVEKTRSGEWEKHGFRIRITQKKVGFGFEEVLGYDGGKVVFMDLRLRKICFQNLEKNTVLRVWKKPILRLRKQSPSQNLDENAFLRMRKNMLLRIWTKHALKEQGKT